MQMAFSTSKQNHAATNFDLRSPLWRLGGGRISPKTSECSVDSLARAQITAGRAGKPAQRGGAGSRAGRQAREARAVAACMFVADLMVKIRPQVAICAPMTVCVFTLCLRRFALKR
jgi:hypothetical protein